MGRPARTITRAGEGGEESGDFVGATVAAEGHDFFEAGGEFSDGSIHVVLGGAWLDIVDGDAAGAEIAGVKPVELARFVFTVIEGLAAQARDGATREELRRVAAQAMREWAE